MGKMVIAAYRPKPGMDAELLALTREHVPYLRGLGLVTARPAVVMRGEDGTVIEVFEWAEGGVERAHGMPEVHALWEKYGAVSDYAKLSDVPEAQNLFAMFNPVD